MANDEAMGFQSNVVAFFDPVEGNDNRVLGLGFTWRDCIASARRKLRRRIQGHETGIAVYHNSWGLPFLAELDGAARRFVLLHSDLPTFAEAIRSQVGLLDGLMCVSQQLKEQAIAIDPSLPLDRIEVLPTPISPRRAAEKRGPLGHDRPLVCGYVGRIIKEQKRVDRLPQLCRALDRAGMQYRLEILGTGPDQPWLQKQFSDDPRIVFHGRREGEDYWRILNDWDVVVFVSDYEGLPIALLEAMSLGVLTIHPRLHSAGDAYAEKVSPDLVYAPDDFEGLALTLKRLSQASADTVGSMRETGRRLAARHEGNAYERAFSEFVHKIADLPRLSPETLPARGFCWSDYGPIGFLSRFYYRGFFKRNVRGS